MAGRGECKWPVCKRRAFYNARRLRCDFFSLLRRIVHSKIKVKSARRRDDFSHPRVHFTAPRSRGLLSDLLELVYTGSKTYLAFSCETLTTLRHSNHAPRIIPLLSSLSLSLSLGGARRFRKAVNIAPKGSRLWPPRETRNRQASGIAINSTIIDRNNHVYQTTWPRDPSLAKRFRPER